jgi:hypothetical protein
MITDAPWSGRRSTALSGAPRTSGGVRRGHDPPGGLPALGQHGGHQAGRRGGGDRNRRPDARRLGINSLIPRVPSMAIGSPDVLPIEMAEAYSTFANMGTGCGPTPSSGWRTPRGGPLGAPARTDPGPGFPLHPGHGEPHGGRGGTGNRPTRFGAPSVPAPASHGRFPPPGRPGPPTTSPTSGSWASPRTSRPPSGSGWTSPSRSIPRPPGAPTRPRCGGTSCTRST